jgi:hypothetical protein
MAEHEGQARASLEVGGWEGRKPGSAIPKRSGPPSTALSGHGGGDLPWGGLQVILLASLE